MKWLIRFFVTQGVFAELLTVAIVILGIGSLISIQREAFPNVQYDMISIYTIYPGSSAEEIERLITTPLEQDLKEVDGIRRVQSTSTDNRSVIILQLDPDQTTDAKAKDDIQQVVDQFIDLPEGAEKPVVTALETKQMPIVEVALSGDLNEMELRTEAKRLERILETIPELAKIQFNGLRDQEIWVEADLDKLAKYEVTLDDIILAIGMQNVSIPGGSFRETQSDGKYKEVVIRTIGEYRKLSDILETVVRANDLGRAIRLKDLAKVTQVLEKPNERYRANGQDTISLTVLKKEKADAINLVDKVKIEVEKFVSESTKNLKVAYVNDNSYFIRRRLAVLSSNMIIGLILVVLILSLAMPTRVALITSVGIPFAFFGALLIFQYYGVTINLITMIGLIIVAGMLVDDAVVITENIVRHMDEGKSSLEAAVQGTQELWAPVTASVMTTIVAFAPLAMMSGIMGKFIKFLPVGVIVALLVSLFECFFVLPHHMAAFIKSDGGHSNKTQKIEKLWDKWMRSGYIKVLDLVLRRRYWVSIGVLVLFIGTLGLAKYGMRFVLFPGDGIDAFIINVQSPVGTALDVTRGYLEPIEKAVSELPKEELQDFTSKSGIRSLGFGDPNTVRGTHYGQIVVYLTPSTERSRDAQEIIDEVKTKVGLPEGLEQINFLRVNSGPPVGKPIYLGVRGTEYDEIMPVVQELKEKINQIKGVVDIQDNYAVGKEEIRVKVDGAEAAAAGLSVRSIGSTLRAAYEGTIASSMRTLEEEIEIRVTLPENERRDPSQLGSLRIPNGRGNLIRLGQVAQSERGQGVAAYEHENNWRQVTITGDLNESLTDSKTVNATIRDTLVPEMEKRFPGISYSFGGEEQDTAESMVSLQRAFFIAGMGIIFILILIFQNLWQPILIGLTIPLGIMSVIWTFLVHDRPLSFLAMVGVIALAGVIVNNAIVLVSFVNNLRKEGEDKLESIKKAASMRLRPIFLTTLTTVAGILPTAYGWGGLDPFVVPIALALGWGIAFGSVLTTIAFPAFLAVMDDIQGFFARIVSRGAKP
jgi:multidrug efflux pump subunit AcrB